MPFYQGTPVPLTFTLTDSYGAPVQAAATPPVLTITQPDQATAAPAIAWDPGNLQYTAAGPSGQAGHYLVAWACADTTYPGGKTDAYNVRPAAETGILSFAEAKRALRLDLADTAEDDFAAEFLRATTDIVEWWCGPVNAQTVVEELRVGGLVTVLSRPPVLQLLPWTSVPPQFAADTSRTVPSPPSPMFPVMVFGVAYPLASLYAAPGLRGTVRHTSGLPFYYGPYLWQYQAGRPVVPECILSGARAILRHLYGMERGGAGTASLGSADEETTMTPTGYAVPNRALELMAPEALHGAIA